MATSELIQILIKAKNEASKELKKLSKDMEATNKSAVASSNSTQKLGLAIGILGASVTAVKLGQFAVDMARVGAEADRSAFAFEHFSGGADRAAANLRAVQRASGGMLSSFEAQNIAVTAMTQSLASNSMELERITRIARGVVAISPVINDLESAFSQLGLTIANQSTQRLDQLGTSADELLPKVDALKQANKNLGDQEAFRIALLGTLEAKTNELTKATVNQATGVERLTTAWEDYRVSAARYFGFVNTIAGVAADQIDTNTLFDIGKRLAQAIPDGISASQQQIVDEINKILTDPFSQRSPTMTALGYREDARERIAELTREYLKLADAIVRTQEAADAKVTQGATLPTFFTGQDWQSKIDADAMAAEEAKAAIDKLIEAQARATQVDVFEQTGNVQQAAAAYEVVTEQLNAWVNKQKRAGVEIGAIMNLLPAAASMFITLGDAAGDSADGADKANDAAEKLGTTMSKLETFVGGAASSLLTFARNAGSAQTASVNLMGAISAAYSAMEKVNDGPLGLDKRQKGKIGNLPPEKELKQINSELSAMVGGVGRVDSAFSDLKSTISGIVTGAIGPVAGVDANDLLPRPDAVNENARRLADIAVNGVKGQDWLQEFANEVPGVWDEIANSGDPQRTAAEILKQFQDGLRPELIDKERAKDLVRTALAADANAKQLVDEIAADLASELGVSLSDAKAKASEVLGGASSGVTGVSLAPTIDASAASGAASTFASAFVASIEGGSLGADVSGAIYAQMMASVTLVETSGRQVGNSWAQGFMMGAGGLPANVIAMIVNLVTPGVIANINQQGSRTGAAAV